MMNPAAVGTDLLQSLRERAAGRFEQLGWPTTRLEEWKYTSLAQVAKVEWKSGAPSAASTSASLSGVATVELIFVNGELASRSGDATIMIGSLASAPGSVIEEHLGRYASFENQAMVALNTANFRDGALIVVPENHVVDGFIHLVFVGAGDGVWSHPRNLIIAGRNSQVAVVETYVGSGRYFTNGVTEVMAGEGAVVDHSLVVCESPEAYHVATVQYQQERSSNVTSRSIVLGGALIRNDINSALSGEGASLTLDGLFVGNANQHIDNHTMIDHISPHCDSLELYKGILDQQARGVFDGRIVVREGAQKTLSRQENRNLLLSETAIVDSKPTLEIHNDDVKCNHGSTIGQLDEEAVFYLRSRGIAEEDARTLLVNAFASEIVDRMKIVPVREQIRRLLFQQMPHRLPERREKGR